MFRISIPLNKSAAAEAEDNKTLTERQQKIYDIWKKNGTSLKARMLTLFARKRED